MHEQFRWVRKFYALVTFNPRMALSMPRTCTHWHLADFDAAGMVFFKINVIFMSTRPWGIHPYQICYNRLNIVRDMSVHRVCLQNISVHIRVPKSFHCDKSLSCSILNMSLVNCTISTAICCAVAHKCPCNVLFRYTKQSVSYCR